MPQPTTSKTKGPCQFTEYQTMYQKNAGVGRDPVRKPNDQLRNEGDVEYHTTHKEKFPAYEIQQRKETRAPGKYIRNPAPMDLSTEYGTKYQEGKGEHFPLPDYYKQKSQPFGDGKDRFGKSVTHGDYQEKQITEKPSIRKLQDNVLLPDDPFDHQTTHQSDFTRVQQVKEKAHRRADQLNNKGLLNHHKIISSKSN
jgi:hypothetical protein